MNPAVGHAAGCDNGYSGNQRAVHVPAASQQLFIFL
jgi:hypothetical protein